MAKRDMSALTSFNDDLDMGGGLDGVLDAREAFQVDVTPGTATELSVDETGELQRCELIIARGLKTFFVVGMALTRIRDLRLYRIEYDTFEAYCNDRWGLARNRAYQLMWAAESTSNVQNFVHPPPAIESHATALSRLKNPELQRRAWQEVLDTVERDETRITAALVNDVVRRFKQPARPPQAAPADPPPADPAVLPLPVLPDDLSGWSLTTYHDHYVAEHPGGIRLEHTDTEALFADARLVQELYALGWVVSHTENPSHWSAHHQDYERIEAASASRLLEAAQSAMMQAAPTFTDAERALLASLAERLPGSPASLHPLDRQALRPLVAWVREHGGGQEAH